MAWERGDMRNARVITPISEWEKAIVNGGEKWMYLGLGFAGLFILTSLLGYSDLAVKVLDSIELFIGGLLLLLIVVAAPVMWLREGVSWLQRRKNPDRNDL